jgi:hypothetical protein
MRKLTAGFILGFLASAALAWASLIPSPPPLKDKETYLYLRDIWNNLYNMPTTTTNPDGARRGKYGDFLLLTTGGINYLEVCTSTGVEGGTQWRGVALSDTP